MKSLVKVTIASVASLSLIATIISGNSIQAQTNSTIADREEIYISNGSRHLREIEPEKNFDLDFDSTTEAETTPQTETDYQLEAEDPEVELEEEKDRKWGNQGDVEDPSIQLDVHEF